MKPVRILIIDDDAASRRALASVLHSDGWRIAVVARPEAGMQQLRRGGWHLVLANVSMSSLSGPLFELLKELARAGGPLQVLFLVPAVVEERARRRLEGLAVPYVTKPIQLNDFLERVSDLLLDAGAIRQPLRRVRDLASTSSPLVEPKTSDGRGQEMIAPRDAYYDYTEEELRQFEEEEKKRRKKKAQEVGEPTP